MKNIYLNVDEDRLEQVFTNLIDNGIRHTPDGGKVTVRVEKYIDTIGIIVADTGYGIPEEDYLIFSNDFTKRINREHEVRAELD